VSVKGWLGILAQARILSVNVLIRTEMLPIRRICAIELMHSWGFALREGVFAETKEGKFKNLKRADLGQ